MRTRPEPRDGRSSLAPGSRPSRRASRLLDVGPHRSSPTMPTAHAALRASPRCGLSFQPDARRRTVARASRPSPGFSSPGPGSAAAYPFNQTPAGARALVPRVRPPASRAEANQRPPRSDIEEPAGSRLRPRTEPSRPDPKPPAEPAPNPPRSDIEEPDGSPGGPRAGREGRATVSRLRPRPHDGLSTQRRTGDDADHEVGVHRAGHGGPCVSDGPMGATKSTPSGQRRARTPMPGPL